MTELEAIELELIDRELASREKTNSSKIPAQKVEQKPNRFQLASQTPGNNYSYGDAGMDTLKTLINSAADLGQGVSQPILHPGQTLQGLGQAVMHPGQTMQGIGQHIGNRYGSMEKLANTVSTDPFGFGSDVVSGVYGAKGVGMAGAKGAEALGGLLKNEKLAGNVVNSLIKPNHRQYMFGKDPGSGIAKEGIIAGNIESLEQKVAQRSSAIEEATKQIRNTPENMYKTVDLDNISTPLKKIYMDLKKAPETNAPEMAQIEKAIKDIQNLNNGNLRQISIDDAYNIKNVVSKMQKWNTISSEYNAVNSGLKQVYHLIDSKIDSAIPELAELNSRQANLISASQAISTRIEKLRNAEPLSWSGLANLPFAAFRSTPAKTTLGRLLATQYKIPK